jgi:type I restriction enzyme, R subunit
MVVSIDKATALKTYDKVQSHWKAETAPVQKELGELTHQPRAGTAAEALARIDARVAELKTRLKVLETTDMAVIVSPGQNEIAQMKALGLDIEPHRRRMNKAEPGLDEQFRDEDNPLRIVFVCAMWLTGFDAPSCATLYLDKPMRNHTLMQTIARANRVFPGKHSGVIVDYANVVASLEKALAIYGAGKGGKNPIKDKKELAVQLRATVEAATTFCKNHGVDLTAIEAIPQTSMERLCAVQNAIEALIAPEPVRLDFFGHERLVSTLYRAVKPDPSALESTERVAGIMELGGAIRARLNPNPTDISAVMGEISELLDESITGLTIRDSRPAPIDLSKINFEALAKRFKESNHKKTDLEALKAAICAKLERLVALNYTRADFSEKFQFLIDSYNAGSRNIEELFQELLSRSNSLNDEEQRHVRESLTEEELVIFDILTRPDPELTTEERTEVKKVAKDLLVRLKQLLVLNWRKKAAARSLLRLAIEDTLDSGLPRVYTPDIYRQKCSAIFEHVYESYPEKNVGVYQGLS